MRNLFRSETAYELMQVFARNPKGRFYLAQLAKRTSKDKSNIIRELEKLILESIVVVHATENKKLYSFNQDHPLQRELIALFSKVEGSLAQKEFQKQWLLAEDIPNMDPFFSMIWMRSFVDEFEFPSGVKYKEVVGIFKGYHLWFYFDEKDAFDVGEGIVNKMQNDPLFMKETNEKIVELSDKLRLCAESLPEDNLQKLSNKQLWDAYKKHDCVHTEYYQWGWIPVAADMFGGNLTTRGKEILKAKGFDEAKTNEYLTLLTQPTRKSAIAEEQENLMKIGALAQKDPRQVTLFEEIFRKFKEEDVKKYGLYTHSAEYEKRFEEKVRSLEAQIHPSIIKLLQDHFERYFYTKFLFTEEQGVYTFEHYLKSLIRLVNHDSDLKETLESQERELKETTLARKKLIAKLRLNKKEQQFFDEWGEFMITKIYRRFAQLFALYKMMPIITEIARRLELSVKETKFMMLEEIESALLKNEVNRESIKQRVAYSVFMTKPGIARFISGSAAKTIADIIQKEHIEKVSEFAGQCGAPGVAEGRVRVINEAHEMEKMNEGDVLVAISTQPDLVPAMKKASAIITDQGGVTSHAAIVAREMRTPCVIGTKIGTKLLKDGDYVKVDATNGKVLILESVKTE